MFYKTIVLNIKKEIARQYAFPVKATYMPLLLRYWSRKSRPLVYAAINELNVKPNQKILEVGYGLGDGLERLIDIIEEGNGTAFGFEVSSYVAEKAAVRFTYELVLDRRRGVLQLDRPFVQALMPYPSRLMDAIFHVNTYYFWDDYEMDSMCTEMLRILKPEQSLVCALNLKRVNKMAQQQLLNPVYCDPVRYMSFLTHVGFEDVHIEYRRIDAKGNFLPPWGTDGEEIQIILARKPVVTDDLFDADDPIDALEREINAEIAQQTANQALYRQSKNGDEKS